MWIILFHPYGSAAAQMRLPASEGSVKRKVKPGNRRSGYVRGGTCCVHVPSPFSIVQIQPTVDRGLPNRTGPKFAFGRIVTMSNEGCLNGVSVYFHTFSDSIFDAAYLHMGQSGFFLSSSVALSHFCWPKSFQSLSVNGSSLKLGGEITATELEVSTTLLIEGSFAAARNSASVDSTACLGFSSESPGTLPGIATCATPSAPLITLANWASLVRSSSSANSSLLTSAPCLAYACLTSSVRPRERTVPRTR